MITVLDRQALQYSLQFLNVEAFALNLTKVLVCGKTTVAVVKRIGTPLQ